MSTQPTNDAIAGKFVSRGDDFIQFINGGGSYLGWINSSGQLQGSLQTIVLPNGAVLQNAKFVGTASTISTNGSNPVYTCPAGRRALIMGGSIINATASGIVAYHEIDKGGVGTFYKIDGGVSTGTTKSMVLFSSNTAIFYPILMDAGDILSINLAGAFAHVYYGDIIEFDAASNLKSAWFLNPAGSSTWTSIYTVPSGKSAQTLNVHSYNNTAMNTAVVYGSALQMYNFTNGTITFQLGLLTNQGVQQPLGVAASTLGASGNVNSVGLGRISLNSGDAININTSYAGTTSPFYGWMNVVEI